MNSTTRFIIRNAQAIITILGVVVGISLWFFTINGLPERVKASEDKIVKIEERQDKANAEFGALSMKIDLVHQDVSLIKTILLKGIK